MVIIELFVYVKKRVIFHVKSIDIKKVYSEPRLRRPCGCQVRVGHDPWYGDHWIDDSETKYCTKHDKIGEKIEKIKQEKEKDLKQINKKYNDIISNLTNDLMFSKFHNFF